MSEVPLFQEDSDCDFGWLGESRSVAAHVFFILCCLGNMMLVEERVFGEPDGS